MPYFVRVYRILSIILLTNALVAAQSAAPQKSEAGARTASKGKVTRFREQRALSLLNQLLAQANRFEDNPLKPVKVILVQSQVADILWTHDEPRSRRLFADAFRKADLLKPSQKGGKFLSSPDGDFHILLRGQVLKYVLQHDPIFAESLAMSVIATPAKNSNDAPPDTSYLREEATLYLQIASSIAETSPQRAAELVKKSINGWISYKHIDALDQLRRHSPTLADELFMYAVSKVRSKPTHLTNKIRILTPYVFPELRKPEGDNIVNDSDLKSTVQPGQTLIEFFLNFVYEAFMQQDITEQMSETNEFNLASFDYYAMRELMPYFDQYVPERASAIRVRVEQVAENIKQLGRRDPVDSESDAWNEVFRLTGQEWIKKAEMVNGQKEKDHYYSNAAAVFAYKDGDFDQTLAVVGKISDERERSYLAKMLHDMAAAMALRKGNLDQAYRYSKDIINPQERASLIIRMAGKLVEEKEVSRARQLLREAEQLIKNSDDKDEKPHIMVRIADVAADIDSSLGFQAMESAVASINDAGFDFHNRYARNGDQIWLDMDRFGFDQSFSSLARANFDRAVMLAKMIKHTELSIAAQLAICRGVLSKSPGSGTR